MSPLSLVLVVLMASAASSISVPSLTWQQSGPLMGISNRTNAGCASMTQIDSSNRTITNFYLYGGMSSTGQFMNDVYIIDQRSGGSGPAVTVVANDGSGPGDDVYWPNIDVLMNGLILVHGAQQSGQNCIYTTADQVLWSVATCSVPWNTAYIDHGVIPLTNTIIVLVWAANKNTVWYNNDEKGIVWYATGALPAGTTISSAAMLLLNPSRAANSNGTIILLGGLVTVNKSESNSNTVWASTDAGASWDDDDGNMEAANRSDCNC